MFILDSKENFCEHLMALGFLLVENKAKIQFAGVFLI